VSERPSLARRAASSLLAGTFLFFLADFQISEKVLTQDAPLPSDPGSHDLSRVDLAVQRDRAHLQQRSEFRQGVHVGRSNLVKGGKERIRGSPTHGVLYQSLAPVLEKSLLRLRLLPLSSIQLRLPQ
jgi:hypothetical protein